MAKPERLNNQHIGVNLMALQNSRVVEEADAVSEVCNRTAAILAEIRQLLDHNSHLSIDWGAAQTPAYITEEANGNLSGRTFSRQQVSNAIGSLDWVRKLLTNQDMAGSQGDHLGNLNQLARPRARV